MQVDPVITYSNMAVGTGESSLEYFTNLNKFKSLKTMNYKSVYINKATIMLIAQWILEITDKLMYKNVSF